MKAYPIAMEIAGNTAIWTRPDTGDCPVSYPAPTYSAVKQIFESVLWGKSIQIRPVQVDICRPLQFHSYITNYGGPLRSASQIKKDNNYQLLATVLIDICYRIYANVIEAPDEPVDAATINWKKRTSSPGHAYQAIFERRLKRGQCFTMPFLGWREFSVSYFGPFRAETQKESTINTVLPSMFREISYGRQNKDRQFIFDQNISITNGTLAYPRREVAV
jgi:CRISPR-associated protein Cas5d